MTSTLSDGQRLYRLAMKTIVKNANTTKATNAKIPKPAAFIPSS
jgi:hypothetical protein